MEKADCPFCAAKITPGVQVCQYCGRDIGRLMDARAEIERLKSLVGVRKVKTAGRDRKKFRTTTIPIILFYLLSIFSVLVLQLDPPYEYYVFYSLGFVLGLVIVGQRDDANLWKLFMVGFIQPLVVIIAILFLLEAEFFIIKALFIEFLNLAFKIGLMTFLGGFVQAVIFELLKKPRLREELFSFTPLIDSIGGAAWNLDRLKVAVAALGSLITAILIVVEKLGLLK